MNIVGYGRVSTEKDDQVNSLKSQIDFFSEYAKKTGDNLVHVYADEGISGTKTRNRKEFLRMMKDAERGLFEALVVKDISRLARNTVDLLQSVRKLKMLGIDVRFINANMTSMGDSEFVLTIFGALAQEESANTSKRVKFGKKINAKKGRVPNIVYGYDKIQGDYFSLKINEREAKIVQQIFSWYVNDGYGSAKISIMLNNKGVKTKRGYGWSQNAVKRILSNKLYIGQVINGKEEVKNFLTGERVNNDEDDWIVTNRPELKIISPQLFETAQNILESRKHTFKVDHERHSNVHLFSTLIKCKECGWSFRRSTRTFKNTYVKWVCSKHNGRGAETCPNKITVDETELIENLEKYFLQLIQNKQWVSNYIVARFQQVYKDKDENIESLEDIDNRIAKLSHNRQKYFDMYTDDLISREELKSKVSIINNEIQQLENDSKLLSRNIMKRDCLEESINKTFKELENLTDLSGVNNAQLKRVIKKIEADKQGNVEIYLKLMDDIGLNETVLINDDCT